MVAAADTLHVRERRAFEEKQFLSKAVTERKDWFYWIFYSPSRPFPKLPAVIHASTWESMLTSFFHLQCTFVLSIRSPWIRLQHKPGIWQGLLDPYVAHSKFISLIMLFLPFNPFLIWQPNFFFLVIKPLSRGTDHWSNSYWAKLTEAIALVECGPLAAYCIVGKRIDMWT